MPIEREIKKYGGWSDRTDPRNAETTEYTVSSTDYGRVVHLGFWRADNAEAVPVIAKSVNGKEIIHVCLGADEAYSLYQQLTHWFKNTWPERKVT